MTISVTKAVLKRIMIADLYEPVLLSAEPIGKPCPCGHTGTETPAHRDFRHCLCAYTYFTKVMKPKSWCSCIWQWKSVSPGESRIVRDEIDFGVLVARNVDYVLQHTGSASAPELRYFESMTVEMDRVRISALIVKGQGDSVALPAPGVDRYPERTFRLLSSG